MADLEEFVRAMPKCELHLHIEGTLEPELKFRLAERNGIELPYRTVEEARAAYDFHDLTSFLVGYYQGMSVLVTEPDFYELAFAYFEKAAAQGVEYAEIFWRSCCMCGSGARLSVVRSVGGWVGGCGSRWP